MVVKALAGAMGFLTRLPVGTDRGAWDAFRHTPAAFPVVGWLLSPVLALPLIAPMPAPTAAFAFLAWVYVCTGINHVDGVADLGDAAVVHGGPADRRTVMEDTSLGVGGVVATGVVIVGLGLAGLGLSTRLPPVAVVAVVAAAEVGAKAGLASAVCLGTASHEGLGSSFTSVTDPRSLAGVALVGTPVLLLGSVTLAAVAAAIAAVGTAVAVALWAQQRLGGVSGDVFGSIGELSRVVALHVGVVTWTLS